MMPYGYVKAGSTEIRNRDYHVLGVLGEPVKSATEMWIKRIDQNDKGNLVGEGKSGGINTGHKEGTKVLLRTDRDKGFRYVAEVFRRLSEDPVRNGSYSLPWLELAIMTHELDGAIKIAYTSDGKEVFDNILAEQLQWTQELRDYLWSKECFIDRLSAIREPCTYCSAGCISLNYVGHEISALQNIMQMPCLGDRMTYELSATWQETQLMLHEMVCEGDHTSYFVIPNLGDHTSYVFESLWVLFQNGAYEAMTLRELSARRDFCLSHTILPESSKSQVQLMLNREVFAEPIE